MKIKTLVDEDFTNYKEPVMFIGTASCSGKCCKEQNLPLSVCQNDGWRNVAPVVTPDKDIIERYLDNDITKAICFGGLEPFEQFDEIYNFIAILRNYYHCDDMIVIYTGYNKTEILSQVEKLKRMPNIVIKFGRYIINQDRHFDEILGVELASDNQYAERIS